MVTFDMKKTFQGIHSIWMENAIRNDTLECKIDTEVMVSFTTAMQLAAGFIYNS